jgi:hypothetical protein
LLAPDPAAPRNPNRHNHHNHRPIPRDVLGPAHVDDLNRIVTDFERLVLCRVQPGTVVLDRAICRLDCTLSPAKFDQHAWRRGGYVHLSQPSAPH